MKALFTPKDESIRIVFAYPLFRHWTILEVPKMSSSIIDAKVI